MLVWLYANLGPILAGHRLSLACPMQKQERKPELQIYIPAPGLQRHCNGLVVDTELCNLHLHFICSRV